MGSWRRRRRRIEKFVKKSVCNGDVQPEGRERRKINEAVMTTKRKRSREGGMLEVEHTHFVGSFGFGNGFSRGRGVMGAGSSA